MFRLISRISNIFRLRAVPVAPHAAEAIDDATAHHRSLAAASWMPPTERNLASTLLEGADASASKDAQHAHDLRLAANAWLRVVR